MHSEREGKRADTAPRKLSGRGLAYWTDGRNDSRILYVTPGYQLVALDAKTGVLGSVVRQERHRRSEARGRPGDGPGQRRDRAARGAHRREERRHRRRGAPARQLAQEPAEREGLRPRVRRADRQAAVDLPHDSAARRVRQRHVGKRIVDLHRQRRRVGARCRSTKSSASSTCPSSCRRATTTAAIVPARACSARASSRSICRPASASGTTSWSTTASGTWTSRARRF